MSHPSNQNKVALVTGASAGIGKAIVRRLLSDGWTVYGAARRVDHMADIQSEGAKIVSLDVTDDPNMTIAVQSIFDAEGRIDTLVNNAGYGSYGAIEDVPLDEVRRQFEVNVFGLARLTQLVLPHMRAARSGSVVNISSMGGRIWMPIGGWYHATKHALEVMSDALRMEVKPFGINVVVVQPGAIESEWADISISNMQKASVSSAYRAMIDPVHKAMTTFSDAGSPDVIAAAVSKAVNSPKPRRRYAAPIDAKVSIFMHWLLPEAMWEGMISMILSKFSPKSA